MPTYDYECVECDFEFEDILKKIHKITNKYLFIEVPGTFRSSSIQNFHTYYFSFNTVMWDEESHDTIGRDIILHARNNNMQCRKSQLASQDD